METTETFPILLKATTKRSKGAQVDGFARTRIAPMPTPLDLGMWGRWCNKL